VALKTKNIRKVLNRKKDKQKFQKYQSSGAYQLWCQDCLLVYTGQKGEQFQIRFNEHALAYKNNLSNSAYAQRLIYCGHSLGHTEDIMDVIFTTHKEKHLDTVEKYHIYQKTEKGIEINDRSTITKNTIFDVITKHDPQETAYHEPRTIAKQYHQNATHYDMGTECTLYRDITNPNVETPNT
jgi:hypothetical protein